MFEDKKDLLKLTEEDKEILSTFHQEKNIVKEHQDYKIWFINGSEPFEIVVYIYQAKDSVCVRVETIKGVSAYSLAMRTLKFLNKNFPGTYTYPQDGNLNFDFGRRKRDQAKMIRRMEYFSEQTFWYYRNYYW